jgi:hypothetical protein
MHICYMDDSGDDNVRAFSLLTVPVDQWKLCFNGIKDYRKKLRASDGIFVTKELHATKFLSGHGYWSDRAISLPRRAEIYFDCLSNIAKLPGVHLFNGIGDKKFEERILERLLNRLDRACREWGSHVVCVSDDGKDYAKLTRRMGAFNPIPSRFGGWGTQGLTKNIPLDRLVEDFFYRRSHESYFIQVVDFCAYALLRSEKQLASKNALGLHKAFDLLEPICQKQCTSSDPRKLGIIRVY